MGFSKQMVKSAPLRIFVLGFMGSGKTHWGKLWADQYNLDFYNLDTIVEENEGMTINSIFHEKRRETRKKSRFSCFSTEPRNVLKHA